MPQTTDIEGLSARGTPPQRHPRSTLLNVLSNWAAYFLSLLITFFLSPFVVHHLGNTLYGIWVLMGSLTGYLGLLDLGVRGAVTRYVSKFHAQEQHNEASRIVSSALAMFALAGFVAIVLASAVALFGLTHLQIPVEYWGSARAVLMLSGVTVACSLVLGVFGGVLTGLQRFDIANGFGMIAFVVRSIAIVVTLLQGHGILALAVIQLVFTIAGGFAGMVATIWLYPELRIRLRLAGKEYFRIIFAFSLYSFLLQLFAYIILYTDSLVLAALLPVSAVTFFAIAANLIQNAKSLAGGITSTLTPLASQLEANHREDELKDISLSASGNVGALMLAICGTFLIRGTTFIRLWMGPEYAELSGRVLNILSVGVIFGGAVAVMWAVMFGISKHKALVPIYLFEALANLALSIVLVRKIGVTGAAWGTTIPSLIVCLLYWPRYIRKILHIPVRAYFLATWGRPALALVPFALTTYAFERFSQPSNVYIFFLQTAITLTPAFVGFWFVCLSETQRQSYLSSFRKSLVF